MDRVRLGAGDSGQSEIVTESWCVGREGGGGEGGRERERERERDREREGERERERERERKSEKTHACGKRGSLFRCVPL